MPPVDIDVQALTVGALAVFLLGLAWYSPWLFGPLRRRAAAAGAGDGRLVSPLETPSATLAWAFCSLAAALATAVLVSWLGFSRAGEGVWLGLVLWLGPAAALGLGGHLRTGEGLSAYLVDAGCQLVSLVVLGALLTVWT